MQKAVIGGLIFLGSAGCFVGGFFVGVSYAKKKLMTEYEARESEIRHIYANHLKEKRKEEATENVKIDDNILVNDKPSVKEIVKESNIVANPEIKELAKQIMKDEGYSSDPDRGPTDEDEDEEEEPEPILEKISRQQQKDMAISYVISPAEFGEEDYEEIELIYWADGILSEDREIIEDTEYVVGPDALRSFGQYEDGDVVYVRNDERRCDYAIIRDYRNFTSLPKNRRQ